jgi:hypothetical protein
VTATASDTSNQRGVGAGKVGLGLIVFGVLVLGAFGIGYFRLVHYSRSAAQHLPADTVLAFHLDLEQAIVFAPFREHVFGALERVQQRPGSGQRLRRLQQHTGVNLGLDLREILLARGAGEDDWMLVVGGLFPRAGVVQGLLALLQEEGVSDCQLRAQLRLACAGLPLWVQQASDGVLIATVNEALLERVLAAGDNNRRRGFIGDAAGSFYIAGGLLEGLPAVKRALGSVSAFKGRLLLGTESRIQVDVVAGPGQDRQQLVASTQAAMQIVQGLLALRPGRDFAGERALLARAQVSAVDSGAQVTALWKREEMDLGARSLAAALERWVAASEPPSQRQQNPL